LHPKPQHAKLITSKAKRKNEMQIIKEPKEYAQEVKNLGFTKIEFFEHMLDNKYDREYMFDCLEAW
tara:strand:+ start:20526 stop:20723 length:198 start_codon:yes stop_codon:yes gene_type:complete